MGYTNEVRAQAAGAGSPTSKKIAQRIEAGARIVAEKFIRTAVVRKNTGSSWELLDSTFPGKSGYTKKRWAKGRIPVAPYPGSQITETQLHVAGRHPGRLSLLVALIPKHGRVGLFRLGLRSRGKGANHRWLVDYWNADSQGLAGVRCCP